MRSSSSFESSILLVSLVRAYRLTFVRKQCTIANVLKCGIYARVSTTDQNCELQLRELRAYVKRRGWKNAGEYVDTGFSGAKASRPALDRCMADAAQHKFSCLLAYKV